MLALVLAPLLLLTLRLLLLLLLLLLLDDSPVPTTDKGLMDRRGVGQRSRLCVWVLWRVEDAHMKMLWV
jgi:hypothetical protein